ncbi:Alcohol dehydrogenase-like 7 [Acorus gramineus]|uniref:Alcohol dehydrogenase-like 7 n=1 Tax=Acorus gramineus TaxID=55184 RepID=A0AAV9A925_ACOGR|nr:Alcohol dehydrogenase-like 7 [Acorus gramineus]
MEENRNTTAGLPIKCKAAVCRVAGEPLVIEEVEVAPPKAWEVRIKIICTSLCHSDVTFWQMKEFPGVFPRVFGHEAVGTVESVGENVETVKEGDLVVPTFMPECGDCPDCNSSKSNVCSGFPFKVFPGMLRDETSRMKDSKGEVIHNFLNVSSFIEYTVVDVASIVKVDPAIAPEKACLLSCGASTGVGAAWKVAGVELGSTVAIFGLGAVGLAVAEGARLQGASKIIGVDLNPNKFEMGKVFGLTDFVNPKECGDKRVSEGWGKTIILGVEMHGAPISISTLEILKGRSIVGSLFGGIKTKSDIPILVKRYLDKELHLDPFITHEISFTDINKAFDLLLQGKSLRCIIWMEK